MILLAACSGGSEKTALRLRGGTYTEDEYRTEIRSFLTGMSDSAKFCGSLKGLSNREVADTLKAINDRRSVTPKQDANPADEERAAAIVLEECARIN